MQVPLEAKDKNNQHRIIHRVICERCYQDLPWWQCRGKTYDDDKVEVKERHRPVYDWLLVKDRDETCARIRGLKSDIVDKKAKEMKRREKKEQTRRELEEEAREKEEKKPWTYPQGHMLQGMEHWSKWFADAHFK